MILSHLGELRGNYEISQNRHLANVPDVLLLQPYASIFPFAPFTCTPLARQRETPLFSAWCAINVCEGVFSCADADAKATPRRLICICGYRTVVDENGYILGE